MTVLCAKCARVMRPKRNGYKVRVSGTDIYAGDLYYCPSCGIEVATGFGKCVHKYNWPEVYDAWAPEVATEVVSYD